MWVRTLAVAALEVHQSIGTDAGDNQLILVGADFSSRGVAPLMSPQDDISGLDSQHRQAVDRAQRQVEVDPG
jgi:hypothetical protein